MIVKVQLPLASNEKAPMALIYNEDRSFQTRFLIGHEILDLMRGRPKAYFYAEIKEDGILKIDRAAPWQEW